MKNIYFLFISDTVVHFRKSSKTRQGEFAFYWQIDTLIHFLTNWSSNQKDFTERAEQLFVDLHKNGFIQLFDVYLFQIWLYELNEIGCPLPSVNSL